MTPLSVIRCSTWVRLVNSRSMRWLSASTSARKCWMPRAAAASMIAQQDRPEASLLPAVLDHECQLRGRRLVRGLVAAHPDQLYPRHRLVLRHQGQPPHVVHVGEEVIPVGGQVAHDGEESLVGAVPAQTLVEIHQPRLVIRPDRAETDAGLHAGIK